MAGQEPASSGFLPNSTQFPNSYFDDFLDLLTPEEWKVLSYLVRRIFGFQKRQDRIAVSQICAGLVSRKDGRRLDGGTGLEEKTVRRCLHSLAAFHLAIPGDVNNQGQLWSLQLDSAKVDRAGLQARFEARRRSYVERQPVPEREPPGSSLFDLDAFSAQVSPSQGYPPDRGIPLSGGDLAAGVSPSQGGTLGEGLPLSGVPQYQVKPETKILETQPHAAPADPPRRTAAIKKGDAVDALLRFQPKEGQLDLAAFSERVRPVFQKMYDLWRLVPPSKLGRGSSGVEWEREAGQVLDACGEFGLVLLEDIKRDEPSFIPARPASLLNWIPKRAALRRGAASVPADVQPAPGYGPDGVKLKTSPGAWKR